MINQVGKIEFRSIAKISPSQFYSMRSCAYKSLLAEAFKRKPLLPISPNAYLGIVLHKILELISKGAIRSDEEFDTCFNQQIELQETELNQNGYSFFLPLQKNTKDFGLKKALLRKHLRDHPETSKIKNSAFMSEKWLESKDKLIAGRIDLAIESEQFIEIIDFKTGAITQDILDDSGEVFSEIKEEYKEQLKLYAYLYFDSTGKFPTQLSLVDLAKKKFNIPFSQAECKTVFDEAKKLLTATNESIATGSFNATPSEANCKYCLYRPACSYYLKHLETSDSFNDISGFIIKVKEYQNGNITIDLDNGIDTIKILNFQSEDHYQLVKNRDKFISIFNLRKEAAMYVYSASKATVIYG